MKNTTELRNELSKVFNQLKGRKIDTHTAKAFCSLANASIKSAAVEAEYNRFLENKSVIEFLKTPDEK